MHACHVVYAVFITPQKAAELQARLEQLTSDADALREEVADGRAKLSTLQREVAAAEARVAEIDSKIELVCLFVCAF